MKCAACGGDARKMQRAVVLRSPGGAKPGRVCKACAKLGWLMVLGEERERPKRGKRRRRLNILEQDLARLD